MSQMRLPVMEQFYTLQGEGRWAGTPAYFIRLAGCDVGCVWCDVKESWDVSDDQWTDLDNIIRKAIESGTERVVITGGEPAMYDLRELTSGLQSKGLKVHIETSGAYPLKGNFDWVCLSPKKFKAALHESFSQADELKVIVFNKHDLKWALEQADQLTKSGVQLYLQPEWGKKDEMTPHIISFLKEHPQWSLSVQTHKYLEIP